MGSNGTSNPRLIEDRLEAAITEHMMREAPIETTPAAAAAAAATVETVPSPSPSPYRPLSPCSSQGSWVMNPEDGGWDGLGLGLGLGPGSQTSWCASPREDFHPLPNEHGPRHQGQPSPVVSSPVSSPLRSWARIPSSNIAAEYPPSPVGGPSAPSSPGSVRSISSDEQRAGEGLVGLARDELCFAETGDIPSDDAATGNAARDDVPRDDVPRDDVPRDDVPRDDVPRDDVPRDDAATGGREVLPHDGEGEKRDTSKALEASRTILDKTVSKEGDEKARQSREGEELEDLSKDKGRNAEGVNACSRTTRTTRRVVEDADADADADADGSGVGSVGRGTALAFEESRERQAETDNEVDRVRVRVVIGAFGQEGGGDVEKVAISSDSSDVQDTPLKEDTEGDAEPDADADAEVEVEVEVEEAVVETHDPLPGILVTTSESSRPYAPSRLPSTPSTSPKPGNARVSSEHGGRDDGTPAAAACNGILPTNDTGISQLMEYDCREPPSAPRTLAKMDPEASVSEEYDGRGQMESLWNWTGIITAAKMGVIPIIVCAALAALSSQTNSSGSDNGAGRAAGGGSRGGGGGGGTRSNSRRPVGGGGSSACFPLCSMRGSRSLYGGMLLPYCVAPSVVMAV